MKPVIGSKLPPPISTVQLAPGVDFREAKYREHTLWYKVCSVSADGVSVDNYFTILPPIASLP